MAADDSGISGAVGAVRIAPGDRLSLRPEHPDVEPKVAGGSVRRYRSVEGCDRGRAAVLPVRAASARRVDTRTVAGRDEEPARSLVRCGADLLRAGVCRARGNAGSAVRIVAVVPARADGRGTDALSC